MLEYENFFFCECRSSKYTPFPFSKFIFILGWSSLHRALHFGHLAAAGILLQHGASITMEDYKSRVPVDLLSGPVFQAFRSECDSVSTEVFSWGSGTNYQLGTGNAHIQKLPCKVDSLGGSHIKLISAAKFQCRCYK